ncbi:hypothetical protein RI129_000741 [Pyrocoelia pectoralis]|uniref:Kazal-like domain-containing protein n=1 Tax=Pyrocoelia pectoralis TaxID=417401 RepID=A0AAN7ZRA3_9COLE
MKIVYAILLLFPTLPLVHNQKHTNKFIRTLRQVDSDAIIFEDDDLFIRNNKWNGFSWNKVFEDNMGSRNTEKPHSTNGLDTTVAIPAGEVTTSSCEQLCKITSQYNPVCGSDDVTYSNPARFQCAQGCGKMFQLPFIHNQRHFQDFPSYEYDSIPFEDDVPNTRNSDQNGFNWNVNRENNFFTTQTPSTTTGAATRTRPSPCEERCPVTPQYSPVCGSNSVTYSNINRFRCAQRCGKGINLAHYGVCSSTLALF